MPAESTEQRTKSCAERIPAQWDSRLEDLEQLFAAIDGKPISDETKSDLVYVSDTDDEPTEDELREAADERLFEMAAGYEKRTVHRYTWSGGGPADYLEVTTDDEGDVTGARYVFQDWFDGAHIDLEGDALEVAERYHQAVNPV